MERPTPRLVSIPQLQVTICRHLFGHQQEILTIRCFWSLVVDNPCSTARDNLIVALEKVSLLSFSCCLSSLNYLMRGDEDFCLQFGDTLFVLLYTAIDGMILAG